MRTFALAAALLALAAAAPGAHAAKDKRHEYRTPAKPRAQGQACPKGFVEHRSDRNRCFRKCPARYELLVHTVSGAAYCVPTRDSKVWYRLTLAATDVEERITDGGLHQVYRNSWTIRSIGGFVLYRRCSLVSALLKPDDWDTVGVSARIPCRRQKRALGVDLIEDVSFGATGTLVSGDYSFGEVGRTPPSTTWLDQKRRPHALPCSPPNSTAQGGPRIKGTAVVRTRDRSSLLGGLDVSSQTEGSAVTLHTPAVVCPPPAPDAIPETVEVPSKPAMIYDPYPATPVAVGLANQLKPDLAGRFGARRIGTGEKQLTDVSRDGTVVRSGKFELTLIRCKKQKRVVGDRC